MKDGIDEEVEVGLLVADAEVEVLVDLVERLGVDALGEVGVLLGPVLEDEFEVGADADGLLKQLVIFLVEEEFQTVGHQHQVKNEVFVLRLVTHVANNISHLV